MNKELRLSAIALVSLLIGVYIYYFERSGFLVFDLQSAKVLDIFGPLGKNLPSFLHSFSFTLFTVIILGFKKKWIIFSSIFWFTIELVFELGQQQNIATEFINLGLNSNGFLGRYFYYGKFDILDVLASFIGVILAVLICFKEVN